MRFTSCLCCLLLAGSVAFGQDPRPERYFPLNRPLSPPGLGGYWAGALGKASPARFQPVEIQLPGDGQVTWFNQGQEAGAIQGTAPSMAGLLVGYIYRLKLSNMADYPGVELYPTIEMVDRLHPPAGREAEFPVIIPFTEYELQSAIDGQLVTKVVYLEQPNRASLQAAGKGRAVAPLRADPRDNPLQIADLHGRPLAIVRLGGRVPDAGRPEPGFFGSGAPVLAIQRAAALENNVPEAETPGVEVPAVEVPEAEVPKASEFEE